MDFSTLTSHPRQYVLGGLKHCYYFLCPSDFSLQPNAPTGNFGRTKPTHEAKCDVTTDLLLLFSPPFTVFHGFNLLPNLLLLNTNSLTLL